PRMARSLTCGSTSIPTAASPACACGGAAPSMTVAELNALPDQAARAELLRCCGSSGWVEGMLKCRPLADRNEGLKWADIVWSNLKREDWLEAFAHHPRIGGKDALRAKFAATRAWAQGEQAGTAAADEATLGALAAGNQAYEAKFGFIFIVCATGKS